MHIPDGYLGPATCGFFYVVMLPIWAAASRIVKKTLKAKQVPIAGNRRGIQLCDYDVQCADSRWLNRTRGWRSIGGYTSGALGGVYRHNRGAVSRHYCSGTAGLPASGRIVSTWLLSCLLRVIMFIRLSVYNAPINSNRKVLAAGIAGYIGINVAAVFAGTEFGLQPFFHHTAAGQALYCPYGLNVAVPAMAGGHLLVFGWVGGDRYRFSG